MARFIQGTPGNDVLTGEPGDTLDGGAGSDTYIIYDSTTVVSDRTNPNSFDLIYTFVSYDARNSGAEYISTADHSSTDPINLSGSQFGEEIIGNNGNNVLSGRGGGDTITGLLGDDTYYVQGGDTIVERPGEGYDSAIASTNFILAEGISIEYLAIFPTVTSSVISLTGNSFTQMVVGNDGENILDGRGGADTLIGGGGNDIFRVYGQGEQVIEARQGGNDTVYTSGDFYLTEGSSVETISAADQGQSTNLYLLGNNLSQRLIGDYGNNTLNGGGGAGGDTLIGLFGDDVYRIYGQNDVIVEQAGQGNDIAYSSGNYKLAAGVEIETLSTHYHISTLAMNLTGNELAQTVIGNYGVNVLDGGGGRDTLIGLEGADVFRFTTSPTAGAVVTIADYNTGADVILLDSRAFTALADGPLPAAALAYGAAATDADDRLIYNPQNGALSYDADGSGAGAAIQFAQLPTNLAIGDLRLAVATVPEQLLSITTPGTFLVGNASGEGIQIAESITNVTITGYGPGYYQDLIFGPGTSNGALPSIKVTQGTILGTLDFSQLTTGVVTVPDQGYYTSSGQLLIAEPVNASSKATAFATSVVGSGFDDVFAGYVVNTIRAGGGNDLIRDAYVMDGGAGNDLLFATINTTMTGGTGADTFFLPIRTRTPGTLFGGSPNIVTDFNPAEDKISLVLNYSRAGAVDLVPGALSDAQFEIGAGPTTGDTRIVYNADTGQLGFYIYGNSGTPSGEIYVFARLQPGLALTADNFTIVSVEQEASIVTADAGHGIQGGGSDALLAHVAVHDSIADGALAAMSSLPLP